MLLKSRSYAAFAVIILAAAVLAACGPQAAVTPTRVATSAPVATKAPTQKPAATKAPTEKPTATTAPTEAMTPAPVAGGVDVTVVKDAKLGNILVDSRGMVLYIYTKDKPNESTCTDACLKAWPAEVISDGVAPTGSMEVTAKLGTIARTDSADESLKQLTVNGLPVYTYVKDAKPGDATGEGVNNVWYVLDPSGNPVKP